MAKRYFKVQCTGHEATKSSGGHPQLNLHLTVMDGPFAGETRVQYNVLSSEKSFEFAAKACRALGMSNDDIMEPVGLGTLMANATEEEDTWEGKTRWKVRYINAIAPRVNIEGSDADAFKEAFAAAMGGTPLVALTDLNTTRDLPAPKAAEDTSEIGRAHV